MSAEAAEVFWNTRAAYFATLQAGSAEQAQWVATPLANAEAALTTPQTVQQMLAAATVKVNASITAFPADDKDAAIRRIRQALERERSALRALSASLDARNAQLMGLLDVTDEAEMQRAYANQALASAAARRSQLEEHVRREATDWAEYYRDLLTGATSSGRSPVPSVSGAASDDPAGARIVRPAPNTVPLTRYTGQWIFPTKGLFYGPEPSSVDMSIQESDGNMTGTLSARFLSPEGTIRLEFQGPVQQTKTQTFASRSSDGSSGTIELIPGSAFNLLEVNFRSASQSAALGAGNFILVKR
jgi:hypothetical protein